MTEQLIEFNTAKLAKDKGFDWCSYTYYDSLGDNCSHITNKNTNKSKEDIYTSPTQSLLQKWLREEHGINVISNTDITLSWIFTIQSLHPQASYTGKYIQSSNIFKTYEEALEKGLLEALKLIKNK